MPITLIIALGILVVILLPVLLLYNKLKLKTPLLVPSFEEAAKNENGTLKRFAAKDGTQLAYRHWSAEGELKGVIVLLHGGGGHSGQPTFTHFADYFNKRGFAVYGLDRRGHGYSDGLRYHMESMASLRGDTLEFVDLIKAELGGAYPVFAIGQSMGGLFLLDISLHYPDVFDGIIVTAPGLVADGAAFRALQVVSSILETIAPRWHIEVPGQSFDDLSRDPIEVERVRADKLSRLVGTPRALGLITQTQKRVIERAGELKTPLLLAHGTEDKFADPQGSIDYFENVKSEKSELLLFEGAYHQLYLDIIKDEFFASVEKWMARLQTHEAAE